MGCIASIKGRVYLSGDEAQRGWLPGGASFPQSRSARPVLLDLEIVDDGAGHFILEFRSPDSGMAGDSWHDTLEEAFDQAESAFGIARDEWKCSDHDHG
jgi:hypothetical protein